MEDYKILTKKAFESISKFEKRLNEMCQKGWKPISLSSESHGGVMVLLEKVDKYNEYM